MTATLRVWHLALDILIRVLLHAFLSPGPKAGQAWATVGRVPSIALDPFASLVPAEFLVQQGFFPELPMHQILSMNVCTKQASREAVAYSFPMDFQATHYQLWCDGSFTPLKPATLAKEEVPEKMDGRSYWWHVLNY